jgi:hypothetical protein
VAASLCVIDHSWKVWLWPAQYSGANRGSPRGRYRNRARYRKRYRSGVSLNLEDRRVIMNSNSDSDYDPDSEDSLHLTGDAACAMSPPHPDSEALQVSRSGRSLPSPCNSGTCRCRGGSRTCNVSPSAELVAPCRGRHGRFLFLCSAGISCTVPSRRHSFLPRLVPISGSRDNSKNSDSPGADAGSACHNAGTSCLHAGRRAGSSGCCPAYHQRP